MVEGCVPKAGVGVEAGAPTASPETCARSPTAALPSETGGGGVGPLPCLGWSRWWRLRLGDGTKEGALSLRGASLALAVPQWGCDSQSLLETYLCNYQGTQRLAWLLKLCFLNAKKHQTRTDGEGVHGWVNRVSVGTRDGHLVGLRGLASLLWLLTATEEGIQYQGGHHLLLIYEVLHHTLHGRLDHQPIWQLCPANSERT